MDTVRKVAWAILLFPACALAGEIYGTLSTGGKPLANEPISVACENKETPVANPTDAFGRYRVFVRGEGRCRLTVKGLVAEVPSYANAANYDFEIQTQDGRQVLRRK
jgi:hypothetical protein